MISGGAPSHFVYDLRASRVVFAPGALGELANEVAALGATRAFVVSTARRMAELPSMSHLFGDHFAGVFDRAVEHVPVAVVEEARAEFDRAGADVIVAIGGGSAIGLGKILARDTSLPLIAVPTTYSGSEMTQIWGMTDANGKRTGRDPRVAPRVVIYDRNLTFGLSAETSAASGMNALAHAVEALYAANASPMAIAIAEEAARLLIENLPAVVRSPGDADARSGALAGAHLAGRALDLASMGLHHRLCHVLGGTFGLPHARTHAALLPHVVAFNAPAAPAAMERLARAFERDDPVATLPAFSRALGTVTPLLALGLRAEDVERAAEEATATPYPNPRPATKADVQRLLMHALMSGIPAIDEARE